MKVTAKISKEVTDAFRKRQRESSAKEKVVVPITKWNVGACTTLTDGEKLRLRFDELDISPRLRNCLHNAKCDTVHDLILLGHQRFRKSRRVGEHTALEALVVIGILQLLHHDNFITKK